MSEQSFVLRHSSFVRYRSMTQTNPTVEKLQAQFSGAVQAAVRVPRRVDASPSGRRTWWRWRAFLRDDLAASIISPI